MFADRKACLHADSEPEEKVLVQTRFQSIHDSGDCMGGKLRFQRQWNPHLPWNLLVWISFKSPSSLRNIPLKVKQVDSEREQWIVALVHCYANATQIGVLNLVLMMPSCFIFCLPDAHPEMQGTDVSLLHTPITHSAPNEVGCEQPQSQPWQRRNVPWERCVI